MHDDDPDPHDALSRWFREEGLASEDASRAADTVVGPRRHLRLVRDRDPAARWARDRDDPTGE